MQAACIPSGSGRSRLCPREVDQQRREHAQPGRLAAGVRENNSHNLGPVKWPRAQALPNRQLFDPSALPPCCLSCQPGLPPDHLQHLALPSLQASLPARGQAVCLPRQLVQPCLPAATRTAPSTHLASRGSGPPASLAARAGQSAPRTPRHSFPRHRRCAEWAGRLEESDSPLRLGCCCCWLLLQRRRRWARRLMVHPKGHCGLLQQRWRWRVLRCWLLLAAGPGGKQRGPRGTGTIA